ncbi:MAG: NAD(P)/FAD-dependent oxidoreductase [Gaiellaceae bacterium]
MLHERSDAVVVGGGIMGAAALHYLAERGCKRPMLLERDTLGSGSTGHCAGGVRTLFSDELNIRIGLESIRRLQRFEEEVGEALDLRLWGYLFLLTEAADVTRFEAAIELQHRYGIDSRLLTAGEARELVPQLAVEDVLVAAFCPVAGYVTPELVVQAYVRRAVERGAHVEQSSPATRIVVRDGRVVGVETPRGAIRTERVICAAGVWSPELAATAGVDLPVEPERRWMFFTEDAPDFPRQLPLTIDFATGFYFHREGGALALGGREQSLEELAPIAVRRVPSLEAIGVRSSWWGYYEMSPDHNAIVGAADPPSGLFYATGFSGHGFQQAPVIGEHLAELALGFEPTFDLEPLSLTRFAEGRERIEHNLV